jgi:hypothetical protein
MPEDDVIRVTGLSEAPAAPPDEGVAKPEEHPAASEDRIQATAQAPAAPSETEDGDDETIVAKKPARGVQKALDRLTARAEEAERRERQKDVALQEAIARIPKQEQPRQEIQKSGPPKQEDFADWQSYNRATVKYEAKQEVADTLRALAEYGQRSQQQTVVQQRAMQLAQKVVKSVENVHTRFRDWDDKVVASNAPMPDSLAHAVAISEDPALVMYQLGTYPQLHARLLQMSPEEQSYYVGRIVSSPPSAVVSKAPAPGRPVGGARASIGSLEYNDNFTPAQHKAWLARQQ